MKSTDILFGIRPLTEAIEAGKTIDKVLIQKGLQGDLAKEALNLTRTHDIPVQFVPAQKLNRITQKNHQGVITYISPVEFQDLENVILQVFEEGRTPLLMILDRITDVRNFGAIARTAECHGVDAVVIPQKGAAQLNEDAVKTSAGALMQLNVCKVASISDTLKTLKNYGIRLVAASEKASELPEEVDLTQPTALIMGSEEDGVHPELLRYTEHQLQIPMTGKIASLNVSVAAGILLYETLRQRRLKS